MSASANVKIANLVGSSIAPLPAIVLPPLPAKLRAIAPGECDAWHKSLSDAINEWIGKANVVNSSVNQELSRIK